jgi:hypothetical protein
MKIKSQSLSIVASIVLATSFIGCSGGGDATDDTLVTSISGSAVDGYISGATICLDTNNNSLCDTDETSVLSDVNGKYTLSLTGLTDAQRETVQIVAQGGLDTASNQPFQGILKSPLTPDEAIINMNTLTTMAAEKITNNTQAIQEIERVANSLGLNAEDITEDILKSQNRAAYQEALKLQKSLEILSEALPSTTEAERLENMKKVQAKLSEGFDGTSRDIDSILDGTTFDNELAEVEKVKLRTRDIINATTINDNDTDEEVERKQLLLEEKRDALVKEMNRIQSISGDIENDLDDTSLETHYNSIENLYTNENQEMIRIINLLDLDEDMDIADLSDLITIFTDAGIVVQDNLIQVEAKLKTVSASNVGVLDRALLRLRKQLIENEHDEEGDENVNEAIQFLLKLNLVEETSNPVIVQLVSDLNLNEDMTVQEVIDTINNNTTIDSISKLSILETINTAIADMKLELANRTYDILATATAAGTTYTVESLVTLLDSYGLDFSLDDFEEKIVAAIALDTTLDDITKATLLNAFSFAL